MNGGTSYGYHKIKEGNLDRIFKLETFGDYYLSVVHPNKFKSFPFPNIPEVEALELFLNQISGFRESLNTIDHEIVENAQNFFKHVIIPLLLFITQRDNSISDKAVLLFSPNFNYIYQEGEKAEKDKNYPNREQVIQNYRKELHKYTLAHLYYHFFTDFYPQTLQLVQEKYRELYEKFLIDFRIEEKFPDFVKNSYIQPPLSLYQLENIVTLLLFFRYSHWYGFTDGGLGRSVWDIHSSLYYNFNNKAPVYDFLKFHYFHEAFSNLFRRNQKSRSDFNIVLFFRPIRNSQICDFLILAYPAHYYDGCKLIAFDVNLHDVPEYAETIKKRDFSDKIFLTQLKNNNISQFVIVDVKGVEITHRVVDIL